LNEFEIIDQFFLRKSYSKPGWVKVGIGDDGAVLAAHEDNDLVVATDTLVSGIHFWEESSPVNIGYKSLAVSLSDLAAMGADPDWVLLNLVIREADSQWLENFASGFFELADRFDVQLVGGDTTCGPLSITVTAGGWVPKEGAITRAGAKSGDLVFVSGTLGDAALGLEVEPERMANLPSLSRIHRPEPRIRLGQELRTIASAAIDVSDGLASDLTHLARASGGMGAVVDERLIPFSDNACSLKPRDELLLLALSGGDDYELCFTANPSREKAIVRLSGQVGIPITRIGMISETPGFWLIGSGGKCKQYLGGGYQHQWAPDV